VEESVGYPHGDNAMQTHTGALAEHPAS
jgi:hypothetical protein